MIAREWPNSIHNTKVFTHAIILSNAMIISSLHLIDELMLWILKRRALQSDTLAYGGEQSKERERLEACQLTSTLTRLKVS